MALAAGICGCKNNAGQTNLNNNRCSPGFESQGPACVPVFDDCPAPNEIPTAGGGCMQVGVPVCSVAFEPDGLGGCEPILPAEPCPAGTIEVLGQTECQPVGVRQCGQGFVSDGQGGCEPVLPAETCSATTMEVLGQTVCQPISDCGQTTWGNIVPDSTTVFVDANYGGGDSDGSDASPFTTIADALVVVQSNGQIAVAAGQYIERLSFNIPVRLQGRCAELVTIRGAFFLGMDRPPVTVSSGGSGTIIRGVTLTGDDAGLVLNGAQSVVVEHVRVADTPNMGVVLTDGADAVLRRALVTGCSPMGIQSLDSSLTLETSVVRDTQSDGNGSFGHGVEARCGAQQTCGAITITGSIISRNTESGVLVRGVQTGIDSTVVRDTRPHASSGRFGVGITADCDRDLGICGTLSVAQSVLSANRSAGLYILGTDTDLTATVVRDTLADEHQEHGYGIQASCDAVLVLCPSLALTESVFAQNRHTGILVSGATATIHSAVVRDTSGYDADPDSGVGIRARCGADPEDCGALSVYGSLVAGNHLAGVMTFGVEATVGTSIVRDTQLGLGEADSAAGITALCSSSGSCGSLTLQTTIVKENRVGGIALFGVPTTIEQSLVADTLPRDTDGTDGFGIGSFCSQNGQCSTLSVSSSLVSANRFSGIYTSGTHTTVTGTVVANTLSQQSDGDGGRGLTAECDYGTSTCGTLELDQSVVTGNEEVGIVSLGNQVLIQRTIVRDTLGLEHRPLSGPGIASLCNPLTGSCRSLSVVNSLVAGNRGAGILAGGVEVTVTSTTVVDTQPELATGRFGRGIDVECDPETLACGALTVADSLVKANYDIGIYISGVSAAISAVTVTDTAANPSEPWEFPSGAGVVAQCGPVTGTCGSVELRNSLIRSATGSGVSVHGVSGWVETTAVVAVQARSSDNAYGYGVQISGTVETGPPTFDVRSCLIQDASLAGILFYGGSGTVAGSVIGGGLYAVAASVGSGPTIADDNELEGTVENGLFWGSFDPCPAPVPTLPENSF